MSKIEYSFKKYIRANRRYNSYDLRRKKYESFFPEVDRYLLNEDYFPNLELNKMSNNKTTQNALTKGDYTIFDHYAYINSITGKIYSILNIFFTDTKNNREFIYSELILNFKDEINQNIFDENIFYDTLKKEFITKKTNIVILNDYNSFKITNSVVELYGSDDFLEHNRNFLVELCKKYTDEPEKPKKDNIFFLLQRNDRLMIEPFELPILDINLSKQYNDDFKVISDKIISSINSDKSGLILLHGEPGNGKTTYVQYLTGEVKRKIVFIPPSMFQILQSPKFIDFLHENRGCILIIEDSELLLRSRNYNNGGDCSFLLNITDGFISKILNMQVICSFNCDLKEIDPALLRKGRLLNCYEFKKLDKIKSKQLLLEQGYENVEVISDMSLAEIYNYDFENNGDTMKKEPIKIGFK